MIRRDGTLRTLLLATALAILTASPRILLAACAPVGSPPGGGRVLQPGQLPKACTVEDAPTNVTGATDGYYWSTVSCQWVAAPYCHALWGLMHASGSQIASAGDTVTVSVIHDDGAMAGWIAIKGGMSWSYPGTVVSGCTTKDTSCTVQVGEPGSPPAEWEWSEFEASGPGRVFILPPSYAPRCQADDPCLDTTTHAWSYVGVKPGKGSGPFSLTMGASGPRPQGVRRGEEIQYRVFASVAETAEKIDLVAPIPNGTTLVPGSETGARVSGNRLSWSFANTRSTQVGFRVKVDDDFPKGRDHVDGSVKGVAKLKKKTLRADAKSSIEVLGLAEIAGTVTDIALRLTKGGGLPSGRAVVTANLAGAEVRLLQGESEIKSVTTKGDGRYSLQITDTGTYTIEVRKLADVYSLSTQTVDTGVRFARDRFTVAVNADGSVLIDNQPVEEEKRSKARRLDVSIGVTLMHQVAELTKNLADYDYKYLFLLPVEIDLSPFLEAFSTYDVASTTALVDKVTDLGFLQLSGIGAGHKAHFLHLFRPGEQSDGWNALVRLSFVLITMRERLDESIKLGDDMAKTLAVAITAHYVANVLPNVPKNIRATLPGAGPAPGLADKLTLKSKKIGSMAWGIGVGLPLVLDVAGVSGATKAKIIETVAKVTRYGIDAYGFRKGFLPDDLLEDLAFEVMFIAIRIGVLTGHVSLYISQTQDALDLTAAQLAQSGAAGDTFQALSGLQREGDRITNRTRTIHDWWTKLMLGISLVRGADGVTDTLNVAGKLTPTAGGNQFNEALKSLATKTRTFLEDKKFSVPKNKNIPGLSGKFGLYRLNNWITVAVSIVVGTIVDEGVLRWADVAKVTHIAGTGDFDDSVVTRARPWVTEPAPEHQRARAAPSAALQTLDTQLDALEAAIRRSDTAGYDALMPALESAYDGFLGPLEPLYGRAAFSIAVASAEQGGDLMEFIASMEETTQCFGNTMAEIDSWRALDGPADLGRKLLPLLKQTREYLGNLDPTRAPAEIAVTGLVVPGGIWITPAALPDAAAIKAGNNFALKYVVQNPGDDTVPAGTISLIPGSGIQVVDSADQPLPELAAGASVEITWLVNAPTPPEAAATTSVQISAVAGDGRTGLYDDLVSIAR